MPFPAALPALDVAECNEDAESAAVQNRSYRAHRVEEEL